MYPRISLAIFFFFFLFFFAHLASPMQTYTPRDLQSKCPGSDACRGGNSLQTRTLDRYTSAGLPECVVSTMSGPPPKTGQNTDKGHTPNPAGNRTWVAGLEGRDSTDIGHHNHHKSFHTGANDRCWRALKHYTVCSIITYWYQFE